MLRGEKDRGGGLFLTADAPLPSHDGVVVAELVCCRVSQAAKLVIKLLNYHNYAFSFWLLRIAYCILPSW
jgi:hypothetical protein